MYSKKSGELRWKVSFSVDAFDKHIDLYSLLYTFIWMKFHFRPEGNFGSVECCTNFYFNGNACTGMMV